MPNFGGGVITPVIPVGAPTPTVLQPLPWTILSLNRYAKIMGINPAHFWQATATAGLAPAVMPVSTCGDVYFQYSWQDADKVSRFDLALEIANAEMDIAKFLGAYPGLSWTNDEPHKFPRVYRPEMEGTGIDWRYRQKTVVANWRLVERVGRRLATLIATATTAAATLVYSDQDGDGLFETAQVAVATSYTDIRDLHVFHTGMSGLPEWEIRDVRKAYISGGTAYFVFDSWLLIDPELYELPTHDGDTHVIDISTTAYFVDAVDVYHVGVDPASAACVFSWDNQVVQDVVGSCNYPIGETSQDGWGIVSNEKLGMITPFPATYAAATGWSKADYTGSIQPDKVRLWYRSGLMSQEYISGRSVDSLPYPMARIIARLATARLERDLCGCSNVHSLSEALRRDQTRNEGAGGMFFSSVDVVNNPFGTRLGEVEAWKALVRLRGRIGDGGVI